MARCPTSLPLSGSSGRCSRLMPPGGLRFRQWRTRCVRMITSPSCFGSSLSWQTIVWFEPVLANDRLSGACLGKQSMFSASRKQHRKKDDSFTPQWLTPLPTCERKTAFLSHLYIKTISLPRKARDKHRETTQKKTSVFLRTPNHLGMDDNRLHSSD